jgi:DNA-binding NarL/FixJ family response regulator
MQVFLVEDSAPVRERLSEMLGEAVIGHAEDAASAIRDILDKRPDVVLLDVSLADGSGFDVLRAVRAAAPEIGIYMLSNVTAYPYRQLAATLGAKGFFDKTNEFEGVRDALGAHALA